VTYDPSAGAITIGDGHWFGTTTMFNQAGSVTQTSPTGTTMWDSSGNGQSLFNTPDGPSLTVTNSDSAPSAPAAPPSISLPRGPNTPAPALSNVDNNQAPSDQHAAPAN
jgi:hypothetical protein